MATVVVFGMACDTFLTMLVLPVLYLLFGKGPAPNAASDGLDESHLGNGRETSSLQAAQT